MKQANQLDNLHEVIREFVGRLTVVTVAARAAPGGIAGVEDRPSRSASRLRRDILVVFEIGEILSESHEMMN